MSSESESVINKSRVTLLPMLLAFVTCPAAAVDVEIESQEVMEGNNVTISIQINKMEKDPQVLFMHMKGTLKDPIAQLTCHFQNCIRECWKSGVSLEFNEENVTLILLNVSHSQSGLYEVYNLSSKRKKNTIFNVTVYELPPEPPPSSMYISSSSTGITTAVVIMVILVIIGAGVIWKYKCFRRRTEQNQNQPQENEMMLQPSGMEN
ncbi:uncharacterized protein si:rp71-80o10.4 [Myxocyprinus asiaticus]|uniref:uncharacterized protein si:rp71-80o10.4 n=1 Tax=Myxocyprinus asiaticus TaxID=70543 RepID=UPI002221A3A2|nr:uncharacterized protein si:rp71-80o10.4 [Myxocyprinus asiaticus]